VEDDKAIAQLRRGDIDGLEILVAHYYVKAVRTAFLITRDQSTAEDIVQSAFVRVYERIDQFDKSKPFAPWFLRSVVNDAVKFITRTREHLPLDDEISDGAGYLKEVALRQFDHMEDMEVQQAVWDALEKLPPQQRAAVVLRYYLDFSEMEAAKELDCPPNTLKWWMSEARSQLRTLLQPFRPAVVKLRQRK
jgi:RNA polymerase sigma-70 factor, ECF subfamily